MDGYALFSFLFGLFFLARGEGRRFSAMGWIRRMRRVRWKGGRGVTDVDVAWVIIWSLDTGIVYKLLICILL